VSPTLETSAKRRREAKGWRTCEIRTGARHFIMDFPKGNAWDGTYQGHFPDSLGVMIMMERKGFVDGSAKSTCGMMTWVMLMGLVVAASVSVALPTTG
jgi:hypothetical protein